MIASHNQKSIERAVSLMHELGVEPQQSGIYFGQLLGMADHLTFILGRNGYRVSVLQLACSMFILFWGSFGQPSRGNLLRLVRNKCVVLLHEPSAAGLWSAFCCCVRCLVIWAPDLMLISSTSTCAMLHNLIA